MTQIEEVRVNKFELKRSDSDDPVAQKVSWSPARGGGANFRTHKLVVSPVRISVARSGAMTVFASVFAGMGMVAASVGVLAATQGQVAAALIPFIVGGLFVVIGGFLLSGRNLLTFDRPRGVYHRGKSYIAGPSRDRNRQGMLSEIHALQIISETVSGSKGGSYTSYELNLVFKDGERINVMDHGDGAEIENSAKVLGGFLGVPVWQGVF